MDDNFIYHPCNFNAVTEGQFFFHGRVQLYPPIAHSLRSLTLILCYIQALDRVYSRPILHSTIKHCPHLRKLCKALFCYKTLRKGIE